MAFTLDTNILLHLLRKSDVARKVKQDHFHSEKETLVISIVTQGEIESIALQRQYGKKKRQELKKLLRQFLIIPVNSEDIIDRYAHIDAYSQGKHPEHLLPNGITARNMSRKNDLWIAATASITQSTLLTTDSDFDHLDGGPFLSVIKIDS